MQLYVLFRIRSAESGGGCVHSFSATDSYVSRVGHHLSLFNISWCVMCSLFSRPLLSPILALVRLLVSIKGPGAPWSVSAAFYVFSEHDTGHCVFLASSLFWLFLPICPWFTKSLPVCQCVFGSGSVFLFVRFRLCLFTSTQI